MVWISKPFWLEKFSFQMQFDFQTLFRCSNLSLDIKPFKNYFLPPPFSSSSDAHEPNYWSLVLKTTRSPNLRKFSRCSWVNLKHNPGAVRPALPALCSAWALEMTVTCKEWRYRWKSDGGGGGHFFDSKKVLEKNPQHTNINDQGRRQ
jgi:hypothetical protein